MLAVREPAVLAVMTMPLQEEGAHLRLVLCSTGWTSLARSSRGAWCYGARTIRGVQLMLAVREPAVLAVLTMPLQEEGAHLRLVLCSTGWTSLARSSRGARCYGARTIRGVQLTLAVREPAVLAVLTMPLQEEGAHLRLVLCSTGWTSLARSSRGARCYGARTIRGVQLMLAVREPAVLTVLTMPPSRRRSTSESCRACAVLRPCKCSMFSRQCQLLTRISTSQDCGGWSAAVPPPALPASSSCCDQGKSMRRLPMKDCLEHSLSIRYASTL